MAIALAVVGAVAGAAVASTIGVSLAVAVIGGAIIGAVAANTLKAIISPTPYDDPNINNSAATQQNQGVTLNTQGTDTNIPVLYGRRKLGGNRVFISTAGDNNKYLYMAIVLAEGPVDALEKLYIDDQLVFDGNLSTTTVTKPTDTKYRDRVSFQFFRGTSEQTSSSLLGELSAWTSNHRLQGLAYLAMRLEYPKIETQEDADANPWSSGVPKINAQLRGRQVANVSTFADSVERGTDYADESVSYSDNPIDCLLDYLRNPVYGKGLANNKINFKSFRDARAKWDKDAAGNALPDAQKHKFNGIIFTDRTIMDNVKTMLQSMRSSLPYSQGRFRLAVDDNGNTDSVFYNNSTSVMTLDHRNLISAINIEGESTQTKYNRVIITYFGSGVEGSSPTYEPVELTWPTPGSALETQYLTEDNDRLNELSLTMEFCTSATTAQNLAEIILEKSRTRGKTIGFTGDSSLAQLDVGDIVTVQYGYSTLNYPGSNFTLSSPTGLVIDGKFRVTNIAINDDYTFSITASEHDDNVYGREPAVIPNNRAIIRAAAGSNQVADIYYPSEQAIPTISSPGITETYGLIDGTWQLQLTFVFITTDPTSNQIIIDRQNPGGNYFTYAGILVENNTATLQRTTGWEPNTTYNFKFYNRTWSGSLSAPQLVSYTTGSLPSNISTYKKTTTF